MSEGTGFPAGRVPPSRVKNGVLTLTDVAWQKIQSGYAASARSQKLHELALQAATAQGDQAVAILTATQSVWFGENMVRTPVAAAGYLNLPVSTVVDTLQSVLTVATAEWEASPEYAEAAATVDPDCS